MNRPLPDLSSLTPAGGKRSSKRDRILNIFLRQKGHLSADDLCDLVRREDPGIGRATVYRTLQWMVDAGVARKVDFGEGRSRFEPSYRHPRHFHLVCNTCHRSSEFLSSDVESLIEEVAAARNFQASQTLVQVFGTCEECRTGVTTKTLDGPTTELVFARDALRIAIATERSGLEFYTRAASITTDPSGRRVFQRLAEEERRTPRHAREALRRAARRRSAARVPADLPVLQGRRQRAVRREARTELLEGVDDPQALLIGIRVRARLAQVLQALRRAVRGLRGQADLPRVRRRGADPPRPVDPRISGAARAAGTPPPPEADARGPLRTLIDLHTHTTASDGRYRRPSWCPAPRAPASGRWRHRSRHHRRVRRGRPRLPRGRDRVRHRDRNHRRHRRRRRARARLLLRPFLHPAGGIPRRAAAGAGRAAAPRSANVWRRTASSSTSTRSCSRRSTTRRCRLGALGWPGRWSARATSPISATPSTCGCPVDVLDSCPVPVRRHLRCSSAFTTPAVSRRSRIPCIWPNPD